MGLRDIFRPPLEVRAGAGDGIHGASTAVMPPLRSEYVNADPVTSLTLSAVYRCVSVIVTSASQMPVVAKRGTDFVEVPLIRKPDSNKSQSAFIAQTVHCLALYGNAYWWRTNKADGTPVNLQVLPPRAVSLTQQEDARNPIPKTRYSVNGRDVKKTSLVHLKLNDVPGEPLGMGPIQSARAEVEAALRVRDYGNQVFDSGIPSGVLSTEQFLNQEQADSYRDAWEQVSAGRRRVAVLGSGMGYEPIHMSPRDAQWLESQQWSTTNIARLFGVPTIFLAAGVEGSSTTYLNAESLNRIFLSSTLMQYLNPIEDALSDLIPRGQEARFKVDALLRSDIATRVASYKTLVEIGAMTPLEARLAEGFDSSPLGDFMSGGNESNPEVDALIGSEE